MKPENPEAVRAEGILVCHHCGDDAGEFNHDTGNHVLCDEIAILKKRLNTAQTALQAIKNHHIQLNNKAGRDISRSHTIKWCDEGLAG